THPVIAGNSPQPFTSYTDITFALPVQSTATLRIHDALGRLVATLVDDVHEAGTHQTRFDAHGLPAGVYTARLETPSGSAQRVMLLVR
ncbi:MAG: T9SS type A sorting domain-containing protein, partial [Ignavibacteriae bacterium]|nr:T9SS type A sorting domain-containing protein [Ignavibacteriota bacterium]